MEWILHAKRSCLKLFFATIYDEAFPFYPIPQGIPEFGAYRQLLRLKAETAFRLHLYSEVKAISVRLGGKYKHIEKLIDLKNGNNDL